MFIQQSSAAVKKAALAVWFVIPVKTGIQLQPEKPGFPPSFFLYICDILYMIAER
jgi:hypothetical protein